MKNHNRISKLISMIAVIVLLALCTNTKVYAQTQKITVQSQGSEIDINYVLSQIHYAPLKEALQNYITNKVTGIKNNSVADAIILIMQARKTKK
jgi:hypothetical protein